MTDHLLPATDIPPQRRIYANRTLNLRAIQAIGYDMDYTLVHYRADVWEQRVYDRLKELFIGDGAGGIEDSGYRSKNRTGAAKCGWVARKPMATADPAS